MAQKTSFYVSDEFTPVFKKYIDRYGSPSKAIANTMLCLDTMYKRERRVLQDLFNQNEINLMLNNTLLTRYNPQRISGAVLADTEDEVQEQFDHFEVDRETILSKLRDLTVSQQYALVDWLIEMSGNAPAPVIMDLNSVYASKDGKSYMLELSNDKNKILHKVGGQRDNPEKWYLFICGEDGQVLAENQPEQGEIPNIKELAELNGFDIMDIRGFGRSKK